MSNKHYEIIKKDIINTRDSWAKFLQLFGSEESVALLNYFSGQCFGLFQKSLNDSIILSILRLLEPSNLTLEPSKQGNYNTNLTLEILVTDHKDTIIYSELKTIYNKLNKESKSLRIYRNKKLGHQDYVTKLKDKTFLLIGKKTIENIFDLFQEFMNEIESYNKIPLSIAYNKKMTSTIGDCKGLLHKIKDYKEIKERTK